MSELLPKSSTQLERDLATTCADAEALPVKLRALWNPDECPSAFLPWLGETFNLMGYNGWDLAESDDARRQLIKGAVELHRHKGTVGSIRNVIRRLGLGEVEIVQNISVLNYDGVRTYNGYMVYGADEMRAVYRVILNQPITNDMAQTLKKILAEFAPVRCHLASLEYQDVPIRYNAVANYDGSYNYGSAA
jgi:phage tail protein, P2 protein I family